MTSRRAPRAIRWLGHLWTLPNTVFGLVVGVLLTRGRPQRVMDHGLIRFASGRGISSWVKRWGPQATTFGAVVVFWEPTVAEDPGFLDHEAHHVRQYLLLGPFFIPMYLLLVPFTGWRRRHPLERAAYRLGPREETAEAGYPPDAKS